MTPSSSRLPVLALLLSSVAWGCIWWPLQQFDRAGLHVIALMFFAYSCAALCVLPMLWRQYAQWRVDKKFMLMIFIMGSYACIAFNVSMVYGDVVRCMVLFYTLPVWAILGGRIFLGERITPMRMLTVVCALTGAWLILGGWHVFAAPPSWVDFLALSSGFAFAMNNLCFRAAQRAPVPSKLAAMFLGCSLFTGVLLVMGVNHFPRDLPYSIWMYAAGFAFTWLLLSNFGSQWAVTHLEASRASVIIIMELVTAVVSVSWINGSHLTPVEWCGAALIVSAALIEARSG